MNVREASEDRVSGSELSDGDLLIVEFDDGKNPRSWIKGQGTDVKP